MLRIRLTRVGKKGQPYYRVVVADAEAKRDGRIVENIGHYHTLTKPSTFVVKEDRVLYWLSVGAQPSDTVLNFLKKRGTMKRLARLRAGESLEALAAEVEGPKETAKAAPQKAAPAPAPEPEEEAVVEMEAVEQPVEEAAAETVVEEPFAGETVVEEPATEVGEAYTEVGAEPEAVAEVVEMEGVETGEEEEGFFARAKDAVEDAVDAVAEAIEDVFEDEEE